MSGHAYGTSNVCMVNQSMCLTSCLLMQSCSRAVQSPALLMWNMMNSSDGTEVMVKGCHSAHEIWGTFRWAYCPGLQSKSFIQREWWAFCLKGCASCLTLCLQFSRGVYGWGHDGHQLDCYCHTCNVLKCRSSTGFCNILTRQLRLMGP